MEAVFYTDSLALRNDNKGCLRFLFCMKSFVAFRVLDELKKDDKY